MTTEELPVFQLINGELVPKPGNKRDPKRRYHQVGSPNGNYLREFTDEEERQRDEEEAKWEAERPQREAEARRREEEAARFRESLKYEHRIVAFLDILGWRTAIKDSINDPKLTQQLGIVQSILMHQATVHERLKESAKQMGMGIEHLGDVQGTQFSDSILLSLPSDHSAESDLAWNLRSVISMTLHHGFVVRGGITYGALIHRGSMAYGPAFIRAYDLEKDHACMPRIILDPDLARAWGRGTRITDTSNNHLGNFKYWRQDKDGWSFYDFLQPFGATQPSGATASALIGPQPKPHGLGTIRTMILSRLSEFRESPSEYQKYRWLAGYFNEIVDEYSDVGIDKIVLDQLD